MSTSTPQKRLYYVENCLPSGTVHLLAGASGAGKTTLLFQLAQSWANHEDFLGRATYGQEKGQFFYVMGDHGEAEGDEHMDRMGVKGKFGYSVVSRMDAAPHDFYECPKDTRILAIDGAECLVEAANLNSFDLVRKALIHAREFAEKRELAVIFIVGSPKMKKGEEYLYGRERVIGSVAWGRFSSSIFNLVIADPSQVDDPQRTLFIYPRHHKPSQHRLVMGDNGFAAPPDPAEALIRTMVLANIIPGVLYERRQLSLVAASAGITEATLDKVIADLVRGKQLMINSEGKVTQAPLILIPGMSS